jgi:hypothetical protein
MAQDDGGVSAKVAGAKAALADTGPNGKSSIATKTGHTASVPSISNDTGGGMYEHAKKYASGLIQKAKDTATGVLGNEDTDKTGQSLAMKVKNIEADKPSNQ